MRAREAFVTSASQIVHAGSAYRWAAGGRRRARPIATALRRDFHRHAEWG